MPRKPDELKLYIEGLAKEKGLSAEQTKLAVAAATGELDALTREQIAQVIAPLIDLTVGRHGDWSREMDAARAQKQTAIDEFNRLKQWKEKDVDPLIVRTRSERDALDAKVKAFEAKYGSLSDADINDDGTIETGKGEIVDAKKLDELKTTWKAEAKNEIAREVLSFERSRSTLALKHSKYFKGEPLDTNPLLELLGKQDSAGQPITSLERAYEVKYGEQIQATDAANAKAAEDALVEKGRKLEREAQAKASTGSGAVVPEGSGAFWDQQNAAEKAGDTQKLSESDRESLFSADLRTRLSENEAKFQQQTS